VDSRWIAKIGSLILSVPDGTAAGLLGRYELRSMQSPGGQFQTGSLFREDQAQHVAEGGAPASLRNKGSSDDNARWPRHPVQGHAELVRLNEIAVAECIG